VAAFAHEFARLIGPLHGGSPLDLPVVLEWVRWSICPAGNPAKSARSHAAYKGGGPCPSMRRGVVTEWQHRLIPAQNQGHYGGSAGRPRWLGPAGAGRGADAAEYQSPERCCVFRLRNLRTPARFAGRIGSRV
jgi:hypothetical protein